MFTVSRLPVSTGPPSKKGICVAFVSSTVPTRHAPTTRFIHAASQCTSAVPPLQLARVVVDRHDRPDDAVDAVLVAREVVRAAGVGEADQARRGAQVVLERVEGERRVVLHPGRRVHGARPQRRAELALVVARVVRLDEGLQRLALAGPRQHRADGQRRLNLRDELVVCASTALMAVGALVLRRHQRAKELVHRLDVARKHLLGVRVLRRLLVQLRVALAEQRLLEGLLAALHGNRRLRKRRLGPRAHPVAALRHVAIVDRRRALDRDVVELAQLILRRPVVDPRLVVREHDPVEPKLVQVGTSYQ